MNLGDNNFDNENARPDRGSDYLWDGSGEPDPEIQKLEALLAKYRHDGHAPEFPEIVDERPVPERRWQFFPWRMRLLPALVTTAAAVLVIGFVTFLVYRRPLPLPGVGWDVSRMAGAPRIGRNTISGKQGSIRLGIGQVLETDRPIASPPAGRRNGPDLRWSRIRRVRLLTMGRGNDLKRIALDRGTIHAFIWATPGEFVVDTPSAVTVDLGCAYTLQVDDSGGGIVRTSLGWVGFELNGHESFIPAGQRVPPGRKSGPAHPTSKMHPRSSASLWRDSILRTTRLSNALPIWQSFLPNLANVTRSPCGICWRVSMRNSECSSTTS